MAPLRWHDDLESGFPTSWAVRGVLWRLAVSILAPVAWLSLTLLYLGFWAHGLSLAQEIVLAAVSVLTLFGALAVIWVSFRVGAFHRWVDG